MKSGDIEQRIAECRLFAEFTQFEGWKVFSQILQRNLQDRVNRLTQIECGPEETNRIRGEIQLLTSLLRTPSVKEAELEAFKKSLKLTRANEERRQAYGWDSNPYEVNHEGQAVR